MQNDVMQTRFCKQDHRDEINNVALHTLMIIDINRTQLTLEAPVTYPKYRVTANCANCVENVIVKLFREFQ